MIREKIVVVIVTMLLAAGFLTVMGQSAVAAESDLAVAPIALGACDVHRPGGGWDNRNRVSEGTSSSAENIPVRSKHLRLGEPCVQSGSLMYLPMMFTDVPVPMVDVDEDGEDDPITGLDECVHLGPNDDAEIAANEFALVTSAKTSCSVGVLAHLAVGEDRYTRGGSFTVDVELTNERTASITIGELEGAGPSEGMAFVYLCRTGAGVVEQGGTFNVGTVSGYQSNGGDTLVRSCSIGKTFYALFARSQLTGVSAVFSWGVAYRAELAPAGDDVDGWFGGTQGAQFHVTGNTHSPLANDEPGPLSMMYCRSDPGDVGTRFGVELVTSFAGFLGGAVPVVVEEEVVWSGWAETAVMSPDIAGCGYLEAIELVICDPLGIGTNVWACLTHTWTADRWRDAPPYGDDGDPTITLCELTPWIPQCIPVLFPPFFDPIDFGVVCADPPATTWEVWDWLGPFLAHYAECLFVPQGGFDRHGKISAAWAGTAGGALASAAVTVLDAFYFEGSCGPLVAVVPLGGADVSINTCTWSWAGQLKIALGWLVILLGAWRAVGFAIAIVQSAIGASKMPNPVGDDD